MQNKALLKKAMIVGALLTLMGTTVQAKETVIFGSYEQDGNIENGPEDIEWEVLEKQGDRVLVLSKYVLNNWRFHNATPVGYTLTWAESDIRKKLNDGFLFTAFTDEEQSLILDTNVSTTNNELWGTYGGESTTDKVFLLSLGEVGKYFDINPTVQDDWDANLRVEPTQYAVLNGVSVITEDKISSEEAKIYIGKCGPWWLRTPGMEFGDSRMVNVLYDGAVNQNGGPVTGEEGVRPAMWISSTVLKNQVQSVQEALNENGFDCGTPDGMAGSKTAESIKAFQAANGLEQTGEIDTELLVQLGIIEAKTVEQDEEEVDLSQYEDLLLSEVVIGNYKGYDTPWIVVEVDKNSALLLSKYVIERKTYNDTRVATSWESSTMRAWLNNEYFNDSFTEDEKASILLSHNFNDGDAETDDYVFLLTESEAGKIKQLGEDVFIPGVEENVETDPAEGKTLHETKYAWGLRTPADDTTGVLYINAAGETKALYVDGTDAVRPAIRISLEDLEKYCADTSESETIAENSNEEITENETSSNTEGQTSEQPDIIASIENDYPIDIIAVKMVRQSGSQDVIHIKVRKNFEMAGNDEISVKYITVNNDGENVCDYGSAWVSALDQGQASWAHGNNVVDEITYEDLSYIKITEISYFKDNQGYYSYSLPESIKVYKDDIVLEEK